MNQTSISSIVDDDLDEAPELTEADLARAVYKIAGKVVDKTEWQKAVQARIRKTKINITLDPDIVTYFKEKAGGRGYQTLINATLRDAMTHQSLEDTLRKVLREELRHA